jgi:hypothetical protein
MQAITKDARVIIKYAHLTGSRGTVVEQCSHDKEIYLIRLDNPVIVSDVAFGLVPFHRMYFELSNDVRYDEIADGEFVFVTAKNGEIAVKQRETGDMVIVKSTNHRTGDVYSKYSAEKMHFVRMNQGDVFKLTAK